MTEEKPFWHKTKVLYTIMIMVVFVGTLLPLALLGKVSVSSEQIFGFAEWAFGVLIGTHGLQRGLGYIGTGLSRPAVTSPPEPPAPTIEP